ncbi:hypothetical protein [Poriferisphaera sp. WC338]|uniref:hypothetical protein n=1 Tax=Poriferisphaera sp. WC338 TaxID=3425129 RepID=UPI003D818AD7
MVTQKEVDTLLAELEHARRVLKQSRHAVYPQLSSLIERASTLHRESIGGIYEPALNSVHLLLISLKNGMDSQASLNKAA